MKKKKVSGLALKKHVILDLQAQNVTGGAENSISIVLTPPIVVLTVLACTRGKGCDMPTIGSGDGPFCVSTDGKGWCGGRG